MGDAIDIERYLSKKDPHLGRTIKLVRAARGAPLRPPSSPDNVFRRGDPRSTCCTIDSVNGPR